MAAAAIHFHQKHDLRIKRRNLRDAMNPFDIPEERFREIYRFPINLAIDLVEELKPFLLEARRSDAIPPHLKVLTALDFFASGSYQRRVGLNFLGSVSQTCVSKFVNEVASAISNNMANKYIRFPRTPTEVLRTKRGFHDIDRQFNFPGIISCIDGGHIPLVSLKRNVERAHMNRKQFHSKNVQFICDADLQFLGVFARYSGATHDSYIWSVCQARIHMETQYAQGERSTFLLGDSGYPLEPWLLTSYRNPSTPVEEHFNKCHCKIRNAVERSIGLLKARWRCCSKEKPLRYTPEVSGQFIDACATLHNILIQNRIPLSQEEERRILEEITQDRARMNMMEPQEQQFVDALREGRNIRNSIARSLYEQSHE